ncbi:MAG: 16S rRNA (cytosine(1402)-N(4))-methyltransferase RsmH [Actinomycetota bacterium]
MEHDPVLLEELARLLGPALESGGVVVDCTLGRGGHARRLLADYPDIFLVGIDRDPGALEACRTDLAADQGRLALVRDGFSNLAAVLERLGIASVRGVLLDLGVSSPQLDEAARGFSFRDDGPLDMRMDPGARLSADVVVNTYDASALERIIRDYGEERFARRIARAIVKSRPVATTAALANIVKEAIPAPARRSGPHPARRTFQALRIEVNDELREIDEVLPAAKDACEPGGRIAVISYHSLEDRRVKRFFNEAAKGCECPPGFPVCVCGSKASLRVVTRRPVIPTQEEIERNPRARSAKLRVAEKLDQDRMVSA